MACYGGYLANAYGLSMLHHSFCVGCEASVLFWGSGSCHCEKHTTAPGILVVLMLCDNYRLAIMPTCDWYDYFVSELRLVTSNNASGHPQACPAACLVKNARGQAPVDVAAACERGEVLNAMLLACAGDAGAVAVRAMKQLLAAGAVPDTWAPNGSSALMLAAAANGVEALKVLLEGGATLELQDALGR